VVQVREDWKREKRFRLVKIIGKKFGWVGGRKKIPQTAAKTNRETVRTGMGSGPEKSEGETEKKNRGSNISILVGTRHLDKPYAGGLVNQGWVKARLAQTKHRGLGKDGLKQHCGEESEKSTNEKGR